MKRGASGGRSMRAVARTAACAAANRVSCAATNTSSRVRLADAATVRRPGPTSTVTSHRHSPTARGSSGMGPVMGDACEPPSTRRRPPYSDRPSAAVSTTISSPDNRPGNVVASRWNNVRRPACSIAIATAATGRVPRGRRQAKRIGSPRASGSMSGQQAVASAVSACRLACVPWMQTMHANSTRTLHRRRLHACMPGLPLADGKRSDPAATNDACSGRFTRAQARRWSWGTADATMRALPSIPTQAPILAR